MFKCELCGCLTGSGVPQTKQVVETRQKNYPYRKEAYTRRVEGKKKKFDDPGGEGVEIVKMCAV